MSFVTVGTFCYCRYTFCYCRYLVTISLSFRFSPLLYIKSSSFVYTYLPDLKSFEINLRKERQQQKSLYWIERNDPFIQSRGGLEIFLLLKIVFKKYLPNFFCHNLRSVKFPIKLVGSHVGQRSLLWVRTTRVCIDIRTFFKQRPLQLLALKAIKIITSTHERTYLPTYETSLTSLTNTKTSLTSLTTTKTSLTITETSIKTVTRTTK